MCLDASFCVNERRTGEAGPRSRAESRQTNNATATWRPRRPKRKRRRVNGPLLLIVRSDSDALRRSGLSFASGAVASWVAPRPAPCGCSWARLRRYRWAAAISWTSDSAAAENGGGPRTCRPVLSTTAAKRSGFAGGGVAVGLRAGSPAWRKNSSLIELAGVKSTRIRALSDSTPNACAVSRGTTETAPARAYFSGRRPATRCARESPRRRFAGRPGRPRRR
jgi:hypothetical protein